MSTDAFIMVANEDGTFSGNTINFDGYLSGVGKVLLNCWRDEDVIRKLCNDKRDIRCLGMSMTDTEFYPVSTAFKKYRLAKLNKDFYTITQEAKQHCHMYLFRDGGWMHYDKRTDEWVPVTEELIENDY